MSKLTFAILIALGMTAAAAAQQRTDSPRTAEPFDRPSGPPRTSSEAAPGPHSDSAPGHASFRALDTNGDGRINRAEARVLEGFDFDRADTNGDASLSRPEYLAAIATAVPQDGKKQEPRSSRRPAPMSFDTADKNKDGRVNRTEAADVPGLDFTAADTNEDASLTRSEFRLALTGSQPRG